MKAIIKMIKPRHVEACKGTAEDNIKYCSKDAKVLVERGLRPSQGKRTDIEAIVTDIREGMTVDDIAIDNPVAFHQYGRTFLKVEDITLRSKFRSWMTKGLWLFGPTGVGKSHRAFEGFKPETHYVLPDDNGWWDGYTGQETVILNDFRGSVSYGLMLQLVDKWPVTVKRRGREPVPFLAKRVIVTSSLHPTAVYNNLNASDGIEQLLRRFTIQELDQKCSEGNTETSEPEKDFVKIVSCDCCNPMMCVCELKYQSDRLNDCSVI